MVPFSMTLSDLAKYSVTWGIMRPLRDRLISCTKHLSYIGHVHEKTIQRDIDHIIVDVFKIISCSEPTDSFMVNVIVAQLPGHSRGTRFYSWGTCPGWPPWHRHCQLVLSVSIPLREGDHWINKTIVKYRVPRHTVAVCLMRGLDTQRPCV